MKLLGRFEVDVFKHGVFVYEGATEEMLPNNPARCECVPTSQRVNLYLRDKNVFQGIVMHECVHAADFILDSIGAGMGTSPDDSEVRAYLAEYIFCKTECILGRMKENDLFKVIDKIGGKK